MNIEKLNSMLDLYVNEYDNNNNTERKEFMKWEAISHFQKHWNMNDPSFKTMFRAATSVLRNKYSLLIDSMNEAPLAGINALLNIDSEIEFVKECFSALFTDDNGNLTVRLRNVHIFIDRMNQKLQEYFPNTKRYQQKVKGTLFFLNLWNPSDNYIYRYREASPFAVNMDCDAIESGQHFSLERYYHMCDEILEIISQRRDVLECCNRMMQDASGMDRNCNDNYHILVFDIIYCFHTYDMYEKYQSRLRIEKIKTITSRIDELHTKKSIIEQNIKPLPDITGVTVRHKLFGLGTVTKFSADHLIIAFKAGEKTFITETAFKMFLETDHQEFLDTLRDNHLLRSEAETYAKEIEQIQAELKKYQLT